MHGDSSATYWVHGQRGEVVDNVMDQQVQAPGRGTERQENAQRQGKRRADAARAVEPVDVQGHA
eukprot:4072247-Pleurochrysis_carterae.AAC.1